MMLCGGVASYTPATAGGGLLALSPPTSKSPPPQNNRAGELGPLPSQGVLLTQYTVFHNILCHYALRVNNASIQATSFPTFKFDGKAASQVILHFSKSFYSSRSLGIFFQAIQILLDDARLRPRCTFSQFLGLRI